MQGRREGFDAPNMRVFGNRGLRATSRPPKPQPTSAISTGFVSVDGGGPRDAKACWLLSLAFICVSTKAGKCFDQSISEGLAGLFM